MESSMIDQEKFSWDFNYYKKEPLVELSDQDLMEGVTLSSRIDEILNWSSGRYPLLVQPSIKGQKVFIHKTDYLVKFLIENDSEKRVNPLTLPEKLSLKKMKGNYLIESTLVTDGNSVRILLSDLLIDNDEDITQLGYRERFLRLSELAKSEMKHLSNIKLTNFIQIEKEMELIESLKWGCKSGDSDGVIIKGANSPYTAGKDNPSVAVIKKSEIMKKEETGNDMDNVDLLLMASLGFDIEKKDIKKEEPKKDDDLVNIMKIDSVDLDDEKRFVLGVVTEPMVMDAHGHIQAPEDVEYTAHRYLEEHRVIGLIHSEVAEAVLVESYIARADMVINQQQVKKGSWIIGIRVDDLDIWNAIKEGLINGFSVGGFGKERDIT